MWNPKNAMEYYEFGYNCNQPLRNESNSELDYPKYVDILLNK